MQRCLPTSAISVLPVRNRVKAQNPLGNSWHSIRPCALSSITLRSKQPSAIGQTFVSNFRTPRRVCCVLLSLPCWGPRSLPRGAPTLHLPAHWLLPSKNPVLCWEHAFSEAVTIITTHPALPQQAEGWGPRTCSLLGSPHTVQPWGCWLLVST